jgi:hypothetical protein
MVKVFDECVAMDGNKNVGEGRGWELRDSGDLR